jgi:hypothetical protein
MLKRCYDQNLLTNSFMTKTSLKREPQHVCFIKAQGTDLTCIVKSINMKNLKKDWHLDAKTLTITRQKKLD